MLQGTPESQVLKGETYVTYVAIKFTVNNVEIFSQYVIFRL